MNNTVKPYKHIVQYYETDRMDFTHHSNYIRWMEEARIDFFNQLGWNYKEFENNGLISPVTSVECHYKHSTTFPDEILITVFVREFRGVKLKLGYIMTNEEQKVVCEASSEHCFLGTNGKLVRVNKEFPDFYKLLCDLAEKN